MDANLDPRVQLNPPTPVSTLNLFGVSKRHALTLRVHAVAGHVIETQHHVLRGDDDRIAGGRGQNIVGRHHERPGFELGFQRQWDVYRHLVAIKVRVIRRTNQWMELDRLTLNEHRLEGLDTQTVQGWRPVQ